MIHDTPFPSLTPSRAAINSSYLRDEAEHLDALLPLIKLNENRRYRYSFDMLGEAALCPR